MFFNPTQFGKSQTPLSLPFYHAVRKCKERWGVDINIQTNIIFSDRALLFVFAFDSHYQHEVPVFMVGLFLKARPVRNGGEIPTPPRRVCFDWTGVEA